MTGTREQALVYAANNRNRFLDELCEFLEIPSISIDPAYQRDVARAAQWTAGKLKEIGATRVKVYETGMHPIVFGEIETTRSSIAAADPPTVLIYGHYDVQRPDPVEEWLTGPFDPVLQGDELFCRGAVDNKGPIVAAIAAVKSLVEVGSLPVNVKFMIEGEEEVGSPSLSSFLSENSEMLSADISLNGDAGMAAIDMPTITHTMRGSTRVRLVVKGPAVDLHSGLFGGLVHNPIQVLAELIAGMHAADGTVTLPGFCDEVQPLDEEERASLSQIPRDETVYKDLSGVPELWGVGEFTPVERTGARPALDILMIQGGAEKSAIPSTAQAIVSMRLVPDQTPQTAYDQLRAYIDSNAPPTVTWKLEYLDGSDTAWTDKDSRWVVAMSNALEDSWGKNPVYDRSGGSIPAVSMMRSQLGIDSVLIGVFRPGDNLHAPNEKLHVPTWERTIDTIIRFLDNLGTQE
jgi:acetylornithine deacetylase/succinyl-diaminopimelate desuccinylase-like protein